MAEKNLPNLRVLTGILLNGEHVEAGTVLSKTDFEKSDWQNLVFGFGDNPRLEETADAVGEPKAKGKSAAPVDPPKPVMPGAQT
jgi:hypothetical protein